PVGALVLASALQVFIFSCWLLSFFSVVAAGWLERHSFMNALRASPVSALVFASALQVVIFPCCAVSAATADCPTANARTAPIATSQIERLIRSPFAKLGRGKPRYGTPKVAAYSMSG